MENVEGEPVTFRCSSRIMSLIGSYCEYITQILEGVCAGAKLMREAVICPPGYDPNVWKMACLVMIGNLVLRM
jgi:hypothetical protein